MPTDPIRPDISKEVKQVHGAGAGDTGATSGSGGFTNETSEQFWQDFSTMNFHDPYARVAWDMMLDQMSMQMRQEMHDAKMAAKQYQQSLED